MDHYSWGVMIVSKSSKPWGPTIHGVRMSSNAFAMCDWPRSWKLCHTRSVKLRHLHAELQTCAGQDIAMIGSYCETVPRKSLLVVLLAVRAVLL
eukprot:3594161-Amphidinium_carterae.1